VWIRNLITDHPALPQTVTFPDTLAQEHFSFRRAKDRLFFHPKLSLPAFRPAAMAEHPLEPSSADLRLQDFKTSTTL
jgi:hypothetical protein